MVQKQTQNCWGGESQAGESEHFVQSGPARGLHTLLREAGGPPRACEEARWGILCPAGHGMGPSLWEASPHPQHWWPDVEGKQAALLLFIMDRPGKGLSCSFSSPEALRSAWLS